jgi:hypothetical protein
LSIKKGQFGPWLNVRSLFAQLLKIGYLLFIIKVTQFLVKTVISSLFKHLGKSFMDQWGKFCKSLLRTLPLFMTFGVSSTPLNLVILAQSVKTSQQGDIKMCSLFI